MKIITKKSFYKHLFISITAVVTLAAASYFTYGYTTKKTWPFQQTHQESNTSREANSVDYNPPSNQDLESSQDAKKYNESKDDNPTQNTDDSDTNTQKRSIEVGISYADVYDNNVEIRAFAPGTIEGSGACTATLTQSQQHVTKTVKAFIDSSSSQCEPIYIPVSEFTSKGKWTLQVTYESPTSSGKSEVREVAL